jgi:hypothetical protein
MRALVAFQNRPCLHRFGKLPKFEASVWRAASLRQRLAMTVTPVLVGIIVRVIRVHHQQSVHQAPRLIDFADFFL